MKKIQLVLAGLTTTAYSFSGRPDGTNGEYRPILVTVQNSGALETKDSVSSIFTLDYLYGTKSPLLTTLDGAADLITNVIEKSLTSTKRDGVDYVCSFNFTGDTLLLATSSGNDPDTGTTLLYIKGISLNNSKPYLVYEVAQNFTAFLASL